ncbi:terminase small subunit [Roseibacterium sp. SDUM158017]|uniref:terminase small subunit n=1 Tax=Roseicyclus salinarum TaxID=3036773 RepID=UPI0024156F3F|nr:terminase small subunit [Roseibacterium sp. SDUM158017]MDG4650102.1 terminase small subunit [Roseibacterium sp. SDUM158017]
MALTARQARFVEEYLIDLNATQAAIRAGYSEKTARSQGQRLLTNVDVETAIQEGKARRSERTEVTQDRVIAELAKIGFSDVRRMLTPSGSLLNPADMGDEIAGAIASVEVVTKRLPGAEGEAEVEYVNKIRMWDKKGALETLLKHLGGMPDEDDAPALNITITSDAPVSDVRVTRHQG